MDLREKEFDGTGYVCPTWDQMGILTYQLARQILESKRPINKVVALAKGGWTWARTLVDYLGVDDLSSMRIKSYRGVGKKNKPQITQPLSDPVNDMDVLVFDEVVDSGDTLQVAMDYLEMMGVKTLAVATLVYKPVSNVKPNYYALKTDRWVVFPHEIREFVTQCYEEWKAKGLELNEIVDRFVEIGLPADQAEYFVGLHVHM